jgi:N-acetylmuramoyl-L-alanine amidase
MPQQKDRGIKGKGPRDRGSYFLRKTHCPAVITEPFFGSNQQEWADWGDAQERLAQIYAAGIRAFVG